MNPETTPSAPSGAPYGTATASASVKLRRQDRDRLFNEAAKGIAPENAPKQAQDPLLVWWPQIKRKLQQGYTSRQIHAMTQSPKIGLKVSFRSLQRFIAAHSGPPSEQGEVRGASGC